ncbi:MAG: DNA-directed RNA polymerase subunit beta' [Kiritimatiellaeota bacterium]|nr:DNA-directed RNA polymerase subunit beta' [Kiritimatiellota bacterium]
MINVLNPNTVLNVQELYDSVGIMLASSDTMRSWSKGEVKNPETINYRTYRPERDGLFCERIFGPTKDWECSCGKYKRIKHKGVICDRCGVEVTQSKVRRAWMGHIELSVPVSHIWFFKCSPSRIGLMLDMTAGALERVLYYEDYMVTNPGDTPLQMKQLLTEVEYNQYQQQYPDGFEAGMGAEAVRTVMSRLNMEEMMQGLEEEIENTKSKQLRKKVTKRMKICEGFRVSGGRPEWMILDVLPVIPPELRPLVPLEGGRFATSDLNDLYRRVINRNNRLHNLQLLKTPDVIVRNEKRMLQEAVDAVFDNGRHGRAVAGAGNRPLKSLADMLKGKTGRFRQNLLGKRVDYSGRSVIIVGPQLKLWQCGLPKKMALVLFEPFIIRRMKERGIVHTVRSAKKLIEKQGDEVWEVLDEVTKGKTVMLNRAPTLHRLSIQSFEPVLIEGEAIQIHPMVCTAFNADFDGDQMAVHVPLSMEAQMESRMLMLSSNSIFSSASGKSIMTPTQDIALGIYYLTSPCQEDRLAGRLLGKGSAAAARPEKGERPLPLFADYNEVRLAHDDGAVTTHSRIRFRNPDFGKQIVPKFGSVEFKYIETTVGRVFFNHIWPAELGFVNRTVDKSFLGDLIWQCHYEAGHDRTVNVLDALKELGYAHATRAGVSIGLVDMIVPEKKTEIIDGAHKAVDNIEKQYRNGVITDGERHNKVVDVWSEATEGVANVMYKTIDANKRGNDQSLEINPVFMMVDSKARGSKAQIRQLAGMRGCMSNPSGDIIEHPIVANFREGLSVLEYFISTHGARKGLADTALKTADAGYLTRKLVDVAQDVIITEKDCNTVNGIEVAAVMEGDQEKVSLRQRVLGRTSLHDILDPMTGDVVIPANEELTEEKYETLKKYDIKSVWIRSGLTCESRHGMCAKCYGRDLATGKPVDIGSSVGIIAAQSIGEPGTQLTMRTFHIGGTASTAVSTPEYKCRSAGTLRYSPDLRVVQNKDGDMVVLNKGGTVQIVNDRDDEIESFSPQLGSILRVGDGKKVTANATICTWDPYSVPVLAAEEGVVMFHDFVDDVTVEERVDPETKLKQKVIIETRENLHPQIIIKRDASKGAEALGYYSIPTGAVVTVKERQRVTPGEQLAKTPRKESKTRDITGGLPRVTELFEVRVPKDAADIAKIEGLVDFEPNERNKRVLVIIDEETKTREKHHIPMGKHIVVVKGDRVKKGQPLTEGPISPQELLEVCGPQELQRHLVDEVQNVYRLQGVEINDKHIEIIVRQMLRKVRITNPGDTDFLWGEQVSHQHRVEVNEKAMVEGKRPAEAAPALLGITKASLETDSFISAASFQDTTRVLTEASTMGRNDELHGFKENVILGHLIPGGTGFPMHRYLKLVPLAEPISEEELASLRVEDPALAVTD